MKKEPINGGFPHNEPIRRANPKKKKPLRISIPDSEPVRKKTYGEPSKPALPSQDMLPEIEAFEIIPMIANNLIASATPEAVKSHARALATLANNGAFSLANLRAVSNIAFEQKGRAQTWMRLLATYLQHMVRNRP